jgi:hypothetical protein
MSLLKAKDDQFAAERPNCSMRSGLRKDLRDAQKERDEARPPGRKTRSPKGKKIVDLEIRRDKLTEDHEREKPGQAHGRPGAQAAGSRSRCARRETTVTVRELAADRKGSRADEVHHRTVQAEVGYLKDLMSGC